MTRTRLATGVHRLGLALMAAGVAASTVLDNYGWAAFDVHPASLWRILGAVLMIAGVALIALF
ncbi:DMT family transporter [Methylobacterium longum]|uniref:DMT family transporter n=1 Tax=Methylobacterium longum TaxID=767694 RepID=A0ABT8AQQ3_9HYPH|nr:DMT family transporter [Methylobacterium longum]MDN3572196.1 DMT family transporter [Methylobacterium longum]GJE14588.1 hypothetical protein FOHLNKBM_5663 [Methylobacterium longum]